MILCTKLTPRPSSSTTFEEESDHRRTETLKPQKSQSLSASLSHADHRSEIPTPKIPGRPLFNFLSLSFSFSLLCCRLLALKLFAD
uniref:Uncharacterized protein n=1 Tax=Cannabis sativa TaxID=3483 RepID=A0A803RC86_CANSA